MSTIVNRSHAPTVLVVEDDVSNRELLRDVLVAEGYQVTLAANARQALESSRNNKPDLVLCDYLLPDAGGIEACEEFVRNSRAVGAAMILITAMPLNRVRNIEQYTAVLQKPFEISDILELVGICLAGAEHLPST